MLQRRMDKMSMKEGASNDANNKSDDEDDQATERDWRVASSSSSAAKERRRQITISPAGIKVDEGGNSGLADGLRATVGTQQGGLASKKGIIEVKLDDSPLIIRNRHLSESLKDPLLTVHSPSNVDSAIEALEQGKAVLVDWEEPEEEDDIDETSTVIDWVRIVPRVKPDDLIYYINDEGRLTSRVPDHLAAPPQERKTFTRPAVLFEDQRKELRDAVLGDGWPCQVVEGKIVIELFGQTIHLDQAHIKPKPVHPGVHARLKLRELGKGDKDWLCQPMAATAEASWVINRYEVLFEYKRLTRRYEPFAVRVDADWRELFGPLAEALTQSVAKSKDARLFHSPKRGDGDKYELQREIFTRIYDGGARFPLTPLGDGFGEYPLPGGAAAYARRGVHKTRLGVVASNAEEHDHKEMVHGPALSSGMPHDWLMDGRESNECDPFDGLHFEVCPSGKPARTTMFMAPSMMDG